MRYCHSRYHYERRKTREVYVGSVGVGSDHPIRVQSMTNTPTQDVAATLKQAIALAEAGCEIVRITAQNIQAAKALKEIRAQFSNAGFSEVPLVADIHFMPKAAMEAIEHVEKVRVNPGNYADKKKFAILEYSDSQYAEELERIHEAFSPLVLRAKELGKCLRIGTNHGSLSDRIMNRFGDTPLGMVESALEFARIAEHHNFHNLIFSFKASNPKVMIQAYRLASQMMAEEKMDYPLHLGVTEAGNKEDGRVKSAIGMGALLMDGLGDTIRVSLTEDPVYEIPVAKDLRDIAQSLIDSARSQSPAEFDSINPFVYRRRETATVQLRDHKISGKDLPRVIVQVPHPTDINTLDKTIAEHNTKNPDAKIEGVLVKTPPATGLKNAILACEVDHTQDQPEYVDLPVVAIKNHTHLDNLADWAGPIALDIAPKVFEQIKESEWKNDWIVTYAAEDEMSGLVGYRQIAEHTKSWKSRPPIWIRNTLPNYIAPKDYFSQRLLEASTLTGSLLCDGIGDLISVEGEVSIEQANALGYNILQGTRLRLTKTEFVACPSCGRTLFDLETTTEKIRSKTGHLKGVTIAVMGCIVNGPGEMADADFGYVGGAPGKVNLYVGKECVEYHIPQNEAVDKLIDLIRQHGKWVDAPQPA